MVVMNGEGEFDMIKGRSVIKLNRVETSNPGESPPSTLPTPKIVISDHLKGILKERSQGHYHNLDDDEKEVYLSVWTTDYTFFVPKKKKKKSYTLIHMSWYKKTRVKVGIPGVCLYKI